MKRNQQPEHKALNQAEVHISHVRFTARCAPGTLFLRIGGTASRAIGKRVKLKQTVVFMTNRFQLKNLVTTLLY